MTKITKVNIYRATDSGKWYYAAWSGDEHDHNDIIPDAECETDAREFVRAMWLNATVRTVNKVSAE